MKKIVSAFLAAALFTAPLAMAAPNSSAGETSGPASGTVTKPSAAVQKQAANPGETASGGVGVAGKPGAEAGPDTQKQGQSSK